MLLTDTDSLTYKTEAEKITCFLILVITQKIQSNFNKC